jgi:hypothetical protein
MKHGFGNKNKKKYLEMISATKPINKLLPNNLLMCKSVYLIFW